jgi:hypothetical protein
MAPVVGVGGVTHGYVNTRPRAERVWKAHSQKKEPKPLTPIVLPGFRVTNFCFSRRGSEKKNKAFEQSYIVVISKNSHVCIHKLCSLCVRLQIQFPGNNNLGRGEKG